MTVISAPVDLTNCDREPIHIPGSIQSHGLLLAFATVDLRLMQWSADAPQRLGGQLATGAALSELFAQLDDDAVREFVAGAAGIVHPLQLTTRLAGEPKHWSGVTHHLHGALIFELEPSLFTRPQQQQLVGSLPQRLNLANQRLQACDDLTSLYSAIAREVRTISGFDRVMLYRFLEEGHGAVVGEAVDERFEPFLGLHYPATDIPQQARRLYQLNAVRAIADILAPTISLVPTLRPDTGAPLDLSYCVYRAVSPIHVEYLRHMGVRASMSISILRDGELWGLIACHHYEPRQLAFEQRAACEMLGLMAGTYLTAREQDTASREQAARRGVLAQAMQRVAESENFRDGISSAADALCDTVDADGVVFCWNSHNALHGSTPPNDVVDRLAKEVVSVDRSVYQTDRLAEALPAFDGQLGPASGCLAVAFDAPDLRGVIFFRDEYAREVRWGGNPEKPVQPSDDGVRLSPRLSFAAWLQSVTGRSREWSAVDLEMGNAIRGGMIELLSRRAATLARLNDELSRMNSDLDSFAYAASHDLREPLRGLNSTVFLLLQELGQPQSPEIQRRCDSLNRLTRQMDGLIDGLLRLSRAGKGDLQREPVRLAEAAAEAAILALGEPLPGGIDLRVDPAAILDADYLCLREMLANLISNAAKYSSNDVTKIEIGTIESATDLSAQGRPVRVGYVRDNGIGIAAEHFDHIFQIFRRLHVKDAFGGGTGTGLAIVRKIAQRHGGRVWVESTVGQGSTFYFILEQTST